MLGFRNRDNGDDRIRPEVKEIQDEQLNINRRVYDSEKSWASRFTEERNPPNQKDLSTINNTEKKIENLMNTLQEKINLMASMDLGNNLEKSAKFGESFAILKNYNEIIRNYINPENNSKTREEIKPKIQQIVPLLNQLIFMTNNYMNSVTFAALDLPNGRRYLRPIIPTYILLKVIQKNLFRDSYSTIDKPQLDIQYNEWFASLTDPEKTYITAIENPTGEAEANVRRESLLTRQEATDNIQKKEDSLLNTIRLMEEDTGRRLSADEKLRLKNLLFGFSSKQKFSPSDLAILEEEEKKDKEFSEFRQKEIEGRSTEAEIRIRAGLPPVNITPEIPLPEPAEGVQPMESSTQAEPFLMTSTEEQQAPSGRKRTVDEYRNKVQERFNIIKQDFLTELQNLKPKEIRTAAGDKQNIKDARDVIFSGWENMYNYINMRRPDMAEITYMKRNYLKPNLLDVNIDIPPTIIRNRLGVDVPYENTPRSTLFQRKEIYKNLIEAYDGILKNVEDMMNEKIADVESGASENVGIPTGSGKPRNKVAQAIHFSESRNDPYLIR